MEKLPMMDILAFGLPILTVGIFVWFLLRTRRTRKSKNVKEEPSTRQERAVWAWAKILSSSQGALNTYRMARVEMGLEVHMPGTPAYQAKVTWLVEQDSLPAIQEGKEISLKVDPQGPQHIYPNGTWAKSLE
jgi:hypothetical protein